MPVIVNAKFLAKGVFTTESRKCRILKLLMSIMMQNIICKKAQRRKVKITVKEILFANIGGI
jgi:hypothetical protein